MEEILKIIIGRCNSTAKVIFLILILLAISFLVKCLDRGFKSRKSYEKWEDLLGIKKRYLRFLIYLSGCLFLLYIVLELFGELTNGMHYVNIQILNAIKIVAIIITCVVAWMSFKKMRAHYDRISSYDDFYKHSLELIQDVIHKNGKYFHYYGPTILPGNIAGDIALVEKYRLKVYELFSNQYEDIKCIAIVPTENGYNITYGDIKNYKLLGINTENKSWEDLVDERKDKAVKFQETLKNYAVNDRVIIRELPDERIIDIKKAYFLSNGKRMIYVIPLHYTSKHTNEQDMRVPHLVGFTSTDSNDLNAFKSHFEEIM